MAMAVRSALVLSILASAAASSELPDLSEIIRENGSLGLGSYPEKTQDVLTKGALMTFETWLRSGPENEQALKDQFSKSSTVKRVVTGRCADDEECKWKLQDSLLCQSLEAAGLEGKLGRVAMLENFVRSTVASSWMYGVDYGARAAMIAKWRDPKWAGNTQADKPHEFNAMKSRIIDSRGLQSLADLTCDGLSEVRPNCRKFAPQALFCSALAAGAAAAKSPKEVMARMEDSIILQGDAKDILASHCFADMTEAAQEIIRNASDLTQEKWLQSGAPAVRTLKAKFISSAPVKEMVTKKCSYLLGECALKESDPMFCNSLQRLGEDVATKRVEVLVMEAIHALPAQIDWVGHRDLITKFSESDATAQEEEKLSEKMVAMKKEVLQKKSFKAMVNNTCGDIGHIRPSCWATAPTSLFCQALAHAVAKEFGPDEVMARLSRANAEAGGTEEKTGVATQAEDH